MLLRGLVFDVDGTIAETEELHRVAFNRVFAAHKLPWRWDEGIYRDLLKITGGRERMLHYAQNDRPEFHEWLEDRLADMHGAKNAAYAELVASDALVLRPGVARLIEEACREKLLLAIATTTSRSNLEALMTAKFGPRWTDIFPVSICGEDVTAKKPDPQVYRRALEGLGVGPDGIVAIEDSENGLRSARGAGLAVIVTPGVYTGDGDFSGALAVAADLDNAPDVDGGMIDIAAINALLSG